MVLILDADSCELVDRMFRREIAFSRRNGLQVPASVERILEEVTTVACSAGRSANVPQLDGACSDGGQLIERHLTLTTTEAALELGIGERAVVGLIHRGSLVAEKVANSYRVDAQSVRARKER